MIFCNSKGSCMLTLSEATNSTLIDVVIKIATFSLQSSLSRLFLTQDPGQIYLKRMGIQSINQTFIQTHTWSLVNKNNKTTRDNKKIWKNVHPLPCWLQWFHKLEGKKLNWALYSIGLRINDAIRKYVSLHIIDKVLKHRQHRKLVHGHLQTSDWHYFITAP